ncbi:hypothetical protein TRICI_000386 [Trichomonascus ciferrii]|uniref:Uncharacterized protein n=1 Tax=Trichomonascus ciferrii TaxID=44093 RepID=A0A642VDI4_9ASCO|nr:hypothetical protein TRICI_000386 [Trichomonascus ciferrii]
MQDNMRSDNSDISSTEDNDERLEDAEPQCVPEYNESDLVVVFATGESVVPIKLEKIEGGERKKNPLNPAPPQFCREAKDLDLNTQFNAMVLYALHEQLRNGLPPCFPKVLSARDITSMDWKRFVEDICHIQSKFSKGNNTLIWLSLLAAPRDLGAMWRYSRRMAGKTAVRSSQQAVQAWNDQFFNPRKVHVVLQTPEDLRELDHASRPGNIKDKPPSFFSKVKFGENKDERCRLLIFDLTRIPNFN